MRKDLLLDLRNALQQVPAEAFSIDYWGLQRLNPDEHPCLTVFCAAGVGCQLKSWQEAGFALVWDSARSGANYRFADIVLNGSVEGSRYYMLGQGLGITHNEARHIFAPEAYEEHDGEHVSTEYVTPQHVIARIDELLSSR